MIKEHFCGNCNKLSGTICKDFDSCKDYNLWEPTDFYLKTNNDNKIDELFIMLKEWDKSVRIVLKELNNLNLFIGSYIEILSKQKGEQDEKGKL